jgi:hypothetical protein
VSGRVSLVKTLIGGAGSGRMPNGEFLGRDTGGERPSPYGIVLDGAVYPLAGQPPVAVSKGWGRPPGSF